MIPHFKLVHKNPSLNDKNMWYRIVDDSNPYWYYCTIWGPQGIINSKMHAVPREDYDRIAGVDASFTKVPETTEEFF